MPLLPRRSDQVQNKLHRLEEQMRAMSSRIDEMTETFEAHHADDEAAVAAAERIRSGAADHKEDGAEALAKLGIEIPEG
jgi:predicted  nucleic acid-binding Zn-ribbon protein